MSEAIEAVVIGAGVVGLACARALAQRGVETIVLEAENAFGTATSARNSEVIHAGIYYPPGSLKARLCVTGRRALYSFCDSHTIAYRRCGKLIVATSPGQRNALEALRRCAEANGVEELRWLEADEALALEPALRCHAALLSPVTGIIDSHGLMLALLGEAQASGAALAVNSPALNGDVGARIGIEVGGAAPLRLEARYVVNAAGLGAVDFATRLDGFPREHLPAFHLAKGNYYSLAGRAPFSHLIYPVPEPGGLGVHLTLDLAAQARFGPDVEWVESIEYSVDPARAERFYGEVRKYWPGLRDGTLMPAYAGIRPKLSGPGEVAADFMVQGPAAHGVSGLVNLFGIESPGLTACLAIADCVAEQLEIA